MLFQPLQTAPRTPPYTPPKLDHLVAAEPQPQPETDNISNPLATALGGGLEGQQQVASLAEITGSQKTLVFAGVCFVYLFGVICFILLLTMDGYGVEVTQLLYELKPALSTPLAGTAGALALVLYVLDIGFWKSGPARSIGLGLLGILVLMWMVLRYLPYMPFALYVAGLPLGMYTVGSMLLGRERVLLAPAVNGGDGGQRLVPALPTAQPGQKLTGRAARGETRSATAAGSRAQLLLSKTGQVLLVGGVFMIGAWWAGSTEWWWEDSTESQRDEWLSSAEWTSVVEQLAHPEPGQDPCTYHLYDNATWSDDRKQATAISEFEPAEHCSAAFLLVSAPLIGGICSVCIGVGVLVSAHGHYLRKRPKSLAAKLAKMLPYLVVAIATGLWSISSIAFESLRAASLVKSLFGALGGMCVLLAVLVMGGSSVATSFRHSTSVTKIEGWMDSDWARGLFMLFLPEVGVLILVASFINQTARKCCSGVAKPLGDSDRKLLLTEFWSRQLRAVFRWDRSSVLLKAVWLSLLYWVFAVAFGRLTTLFLLWLGKEMLKISLLLTTVVYIMTGLSMFLLPPVPGMPVYLTGGLVIAPRAEVEFDSFIAGAAYASALAFGVKLVAIAMQQKVIGGMLGKTVTVRRAVQINSPTMKAIKLILDTPGMSFGKVGGPLSRNSETLPYLHSLTALLHC
eukprot:SAG22_NODE_153_length_17315_cov_69.981935_9_plen_683_part_00